MNAVVADNSKVTVTIEGTNAAAAVSTWKLQVQSKEEAQALLEKNESIASKKEIEGPGREKKVALEKEIESPGREKKVAKPNAK